MNNEKCKRCDGAGFTKNGLEEYTGQCDSCGSTGLATEAGIPATGVQMPHTTYNGYSDGSEPLWTKDQMQEYGDARAEEARREGYNAGLIKGYDDGMKETQELCKPAAQRTAGGSYADGRMLAAGGASTAGPVAEAAAQADDVGDVHDRAYFDRAFAASPTAQPTHETIVQEGETLVCTACGTTAQPTPPDDEIARAKRVMKAIDAYMDAPDRFKRTDVRAALLDEFAALRHPPVTNVPAIVLRDMLAIQEACGLHTDEYAPGSVIEYIKELEADSAQPTQAGTETAAAATIDTLTRYGFDGTLGGDFGEDLDGPYVQLDDVRAAIAAAREEAVRAWAKCEQLEVMNTNCNSIIADLRARLASAGAGEPAAPAPADEDAARALQKLSRALGIFEHETATGSAPDNWPVWAVTSSWSGEETITLADIRAICAARQDSAAADKGEA